MGGNTSKQTPTAGAVPGRCDNRSSTSSSADEVGGKRRPPNFAAGKGQANDKSDQNSGGTTMRVSNPKHSAMIVVAVDFGTTFSGYAFSFKNEPDEVCTHYWKGNLRTPTVVLFDKSGKFHSFGDDAYEHYERLMKLGTHQEWYLFERFKMKLFASDMSLHKDMMIEEILGKSMRGFDIFVEAIRYIKEHFLRNLKTKIKNALMENKDIHWVLTVPAIWNDRSKRFMRDAAVQAGIPDEMLTLALEPEAASVYCMKTRDIDLPTGSRYIVLDLGGGTADITCHEVGSDGTLAELNPPTGGDFGGTNIDNRFVSVLNRIFGNIVIREFKSKRTGDYWELMKDFERKKKTFDASQRVTLKFPVEILETFEKKIESKLEETMRQSSLEREVEFHQDKILLSTGLVKQMFDEEVRKVVNAIQELLNKIENITHVIMVGGFSESPYLQKIMKEQFGNLVVLPEEPSAAVVKGAVMYGHSGQVIASRVCRYTYGIARMVKFKANLHPIEKKKTIDGVEHCDDVFNKHIEIGTEVSIASQENVIEHEYFPPTGNAKQAVLEVYASSQRDPKFVDEPGCQFVGLIKIDIDPKGNRWSKLMIKMLFGGTEIKIQVRDVKNKTVIYGSVDSFG